MLMDSTSRRIIASYMDEATAPMFLSGFFQSPPQNFHDSEKVEIDIQRDDEDIAIVIQDLSTGARENELGKYVTKAFTPPIYDEEGVINSFNLIKRMPGTNPFADPDVQANAINQAFSIFRKLENKVRRAIELQCAQVLQTGGLSLTDPAGNVLYVLDYVPKVTHFVTIGTPWAVDGTTGNPFSDISALAEVLRKDGRRQPKQLIMGTSALQRFLQSAQVRTQLNSFGMQQLAQLAPETRGQGATFVGRFWIGNYWFDVWSYNAVYRNPASGVYTPYVDANKVIMLSENGRLDLSYGGIPRIIGPDQRVLQFLPSRISGGDQGLDLSTYAWITPDGKHLAVSAGTRPLAIPTAIDTFGALTVA